MGNTAQDMKFTRESILNRNDVACFDILLDMLHATNVTSSRRAASAVFTLIQKCRNYYRAEMPSGMIPLFDVAQAAAVDADGIARATVGSSCSHLHSLWQLAIFPPIVTRMASKPDEESVRSKTWTALYGREHTVRWSDNRKDEGVTGDFLKLVYEDVTAESYIIEMLKCADRRVLGEHIIALVQTVRVAVARGTRPGELGPIERLLLAVLDPTMPVWTISEFTLALAKLALNDDARGGPHEFIADAFLDKCVIGIYSRAPLSSEQYAALLQAVTVFLGGSGTNVSYSIVRALRAANGAVQSATSAGVPIQLANIGLGLAIAAISGLAGAKQPGWTLPHGVNEDIVLAALPHMDALRDASVKFASDEALKSITEVLLGCGMPVTVAVMAKYAACKVGDRLRFLTFGTPGNRCSAWDIGLKREGRALQAAVGTIHALLALDDASNEFVVAAELLGRVGACCPEVLGKALLQIHVLQEDACGADGEAIVDLAGCSPEDSLVNTLALVRACVARKHVYGPCLFLLSHCAECRSCADLLLKQLLVRALERHSHRRICIL